MAWNFSSNSDIRQSSDGTLFSLPVNGVIRGLRVRVMRFARRWLPLGVVFVVASKFLLHLLAV